MIYQCGDDSSIHVFNEPWSADAFWDAQVRYYDVVFDYLIEYSTCRHTSLRVGALLASYCTPTRPSFQVLGQNRDTWLLHGVPTSLRTFKMETVLLADALLDGFQLYVHKCPFVTADYFLG